MTEIIRKFETGATRDSDSGKLDMEGFFSHVAMERFAQYMDRHRVQADGSLRASDNWMKGIPLDIYMKSAWRHFFAWWKIHRGGTVFDERDGHRVSADEAICGLWFNLQGYLHEILSGVKNEHEILSGVKNETDSEPPATIPIRRHSEAKLDALVETIQRI